MKIKIPNKIFGEPINGSYQRYLDGSIKTEKIEEKVQPITSSSNINLGDYIVLPNHNLYVAKQKTLFNNNWFDAHKGLSQLGLKMLTIREFLDFLELLKQGNVKNGLGNLVSATEVRAIYDDITKQESPYRAEWLDADFKVQSNQLYMNYNHTVSSGNLIPNKTEKLESCLMEDCKIDLSSCNRQGLPTREGNDISYFYPRDDNNSVARFRANSVWVYLNCNGGPQFSDSALGVRGSARFLRS